MKILNDVVVSIAKAELQEFVSICKIRSDNHLPCKDCKFSDLCMSIVNYACDNNLDLKDYE